LYRRKDVEQALEIKRLLYEKRYTIEGARKFLETRAKTEVLPSAAAGKRKGRAKSGAGKAVAAAAPPPGQAGLFDAPSPAVLELVRKELREIAEMLK
jgi:DNA-binding transcriptional MerR regulator